MKWFWYVAAVVWLVACTPPAMLRFGAIVEPRTPTCRPSAEDLSLKVAETYATDPLRWYRGRTATQVQRDCVEEGLTGIAMPRVIRLARDLGCQSELGFAFTYYSKITAKLGPLYEAQSMKNGTWDVTTSGRDYHFPWYIESHIQACVTTSSKAAACAARITPAVATYLDIQVVGGKCVKGAPFTVSPPLEPYDAVRGELGMVNVRNPAPVPNATQKALLATALADHNALSPATGAARIAAEDSATTETQQHFFRSKDFMSDLDPGWSPAEVMQWHALQNRFMSLWAAKRDAGDWFAARQADSDHQLSHICAALKDDRLLVLFSCPAGLGKAGSMDLCPIMSCAQALAALR